MIVTSLNEFSKCLHFSKIDICYVYFLTMCLVMVYFSLFLADVLPHVALFIVHFCQISDIHVVYLLMYQA